MKKQRELYKKYRPHNLSRMVGQDMAVKTLRRMIETNSIPHTLLFTGPTGCGKTTLARIIRRKLKCSKFDFIEDAPRKIEDVRTIKLRTGGAPMKGDVRIWLIDECHKLTLDAQDEFLKMLEDTPNHVYFMLTTTDPRKLKKTLINRCTEIVVKSISTDDLIKLLRYVCKEERAKIPKEVIIRIVKNSDGSARKALVYLHQIISLKTKGEMLDAIITTTAETQAIQIARHLLNPHTKWEQMAKVLRACETEQPEQLRWMVLGYAKAVMLTGNTKLLNRAYAMIEAFRDNFYDSKMAGLAAACFEVIIGEK